MSESNVTEQTAEARGFRKTREGLVVSDKMDKTVVVAVEDRVKHALYGKVIRRTNKLKAHDEQNAAGVGDRVQARPQGLATDRPLRRRRHERSPGLLPLDLRPLLVASWGTRSFQTGPVHVEKQRICRKRTGKDSWFGAETLTEWGSSKARSR
jgi:small subunit ribosomal protein S17